MNGKAIASHSFVRFLLVGVLNTVLSAVLMFLLYDCFHLSYWPATAIAYVAGAVVSFFLNFRFTFKSNANPALAALRFAVNVAVCYVIAYSLAQPLVKTVFSGVLTPEWSERAAMVAGMGLYTILNYLGQRFFAFRRRKSVNPDEKT